MLLLFLKTSFFEFEIELKVIMQDTVIVLELLLCASVLLGFIFGPKIYIMLSYEPVVVEVRPQNVMKDFVFDNDLFEKGRVLSNYCEILKQGSDKMWASITRIFPN